jgi:hypothetical protein
MVSVTLTIDSATLEAARLEAARRNTSVEAMISEYVASIAHPPKALRNADNLIRLMEEGILGDLGKLPTRDEIYEERTQWPRS